MTACFTWAIASFLSISAIKVCKILAFSTKLVAVANLDTKALLPVSIALFTAICTFSSTRETFFSPAKVWTAVKASLVILANSLVIVTTNKTLPGPANAEEIPLSKTFPIENPAFSPPSAAAPKLRVSNILLPIPIKLSRTGFTVAFPVSAKNWVTLFFNFCKFASVVSVKIFNLSAAFPEESETVLIALSNKLYSPVKDFNVAWRVLIWYTPATCSRTNALCLSDKVSNLLAKSVRTSICDLNSPFESWVVTPILFKVSWTFVLLNLVKIVFKPLDITGAPRAETCWTTAIKEAISLSSIPAELATLPTLFKPSDIPAALIANALSRETIVSKTSV